MHASPALQAARLTALFRRIVERDRVDERPEGRPLEMLRRKDPAPYGLTVSHSRLQGPRPPSRLAGEELSSPAIIAEAATTDLTMFW